MQQEQDCTSHRYNTGSTDRLSVLYQPSLQHRQYGPTVNRSSDSMEQPRNRAIFKDLDTLRNVSKCLQLRNNPKKYKLQIMFSHRFSIGHIYCN